MKYYVYVYLDPRKPGNFVYGEYEFDYEPYYVGKGKNDRVNNCKAKAIEIINKEIVSQSLEPIKIIYKDSLSEMESFKLEAKMIKEIGRTYDNGTLCNIVKDQSELASKRHRNKRRAKEKRKKVENIKAQNEMSNFIEDLFNSTQE